MAPPDLKRTLDLVEPATTGSAAAPAPPQTPGNAAVSRLPTNAAQETAPKSATPANSEPPPYFDDALQDAEQLMKYAAEVGVDIDDDTRNHILTARTHVGVLSNEEAANLLTALTKLAARLKPVTAESLKGYTVADGRRTVRGYWKWGLCLAAIIVPFSAANFVTSVISDEIRKDIVTADELALKLTAQLGLAKVPVAAATAAQPKFEPPAGFAGVEIVPELQQFASLISHIDSRAQTLNVFVFPQQHDIYTEIRNNPRAMHATFQLPAEFAHHQIEAADDRIAVYQDVRYFSQELLDYVSYFYGAVTNCVLPVLYALLGACAYLLRSFEEQTKNRTFIPPNVNFSRFLIAGIGGAVVGLFNNNFALRQGSSIPPLAVAFLVGYSVDVFFLFLESLFPAITKTKSGGNSGGSTS